MINNKLMIEKSKNNNTIKEEYNTNNKKRGQKMYIKYLIVDKQNQ